MVGTITKQIGNGPDALTPTIPTSIYLVSVERVIKGVAGSTIRLKITGGVSQGTVVEIADDPLPAIGERDLLFLRHVVGGPYDGVYFEIGGGDGRYRISASGTLDSPGADVKLAAGTTLGTVLAALP